MTDREHADYLISLGRAHGFVLGMKRANEILRAHGIDVVHPARSQLFDELMDSDRASVTAYMHGAISAVPRRSTAA
jgi:hypothetical protein